MQIKSERIQSSRPKRFAPEGWLHYNVRVFLEADSKDLSDVDMVVYLLDPSFGDERYVVSVEKRRQFEIDIWTYDFFEASARVLFKTGSRYETVTGDIEWEGRVEAREEE